MVDFIIGLVVGMILILIVQRVVVAYSKRDKREARIRDVVDTYRANANSHPPKTSGFNGLIQAGVFTLRTDMEIREAVDQITTYGDKSPFGKYQDLLTEIDLHDFFALVKERGYDFFRDGSPTEIVQELKASQRKKDAQCPQ